MNGKEFVSRLLRVSKYRNAYDTNGYFRNQLSRLENKEEIHTQDLIECMVSLSNELTQKDIDMLDHLDQGFLREDVL